MDKPKTKFEVKRNKACPSKTELQMSVIDCLLAQFSRKGMHL